MCTYEDLVAATLPYGLSPLVVPQLKTITLGGAVTGLGIESASFRNGLPHESVLEMDILTGAGEVVTASRDQHADLFRAFPNSYGTLGYAVRLKIELEPVKPFVSAAAPAVHLAWPTWSPRWTASSRPAASTARRVDYLDGVVFSADESYLCLGVQTATPGPVSDYTGQHIYYRSIQHADGREARPADHPRLPVALGHRLVLVLAGVRRAEPDDPAVLAAALPAQQLLLEADRLRPALRHRRPHREAQRPAAAANASCRTSRCRSGGPPSSWTGSSTNVPIEPIWLCPLRLRDDAGWPLYPIAAHHTYVNVGFWSSVPVGSAERARRTG